MSGRDQKGHGWMLRASSLMRVCLENGTSGVRPPTRLSFFKGSDKREQRLDVCMRVYRPISFLVQVSPSVPFLFFFFSLSRFQFLLHRRTPIHRARNDAGAASYKILLRSVYSGVDIILIERD